MIENKILAMYWGGWLAAVSVGWSLRGIIDKLVVAS